MLNRCNSESSGDWKNYGGRGIKVCDRWLKFENFLEDNLDSYKDYLSIDRIDVNGNYEPSNCRWANFSTQNRNRRTVKLTVKDIPKIFYFRKSGLYQKEIAEIFGVHRKTIGDVLGGKTWT